MRVRLYTHLRDKKVDQLVAVSDVHLRIHEEEILFSRPAATTGGARRLASRTNL